MIHVRENTALPVDIDLDAGRIRVMARFLEIVGVFCGDIEGEFNGLIG